MEDGLLNAKMAMKTKGESINQPFPLDWKGLFPTPRIE